MGVERRRARGRIGLRAVENGVADLQNAGLVDLPRSMQRVGVRQAYVCAFVMREIQVVAAERMRDPARNANYGRSVDVIAERLGR